MEQPLVDGDLSCFHARIIAPRYDAVRHVRDESP